MGCCWWLRCKVLTTVLRCLPPAAAPRGRGAAGTTAYELVQAYPVAFSLFNTQRTVQGALAPMRSRGHSPLCGCWIDQQAAKLTPPIEMTVIDRALLCAVCGRSGTVQ
jgi:hypothetical protein